MNRELNNLYNEFHTSVESLRVSRGLSKITSDKEMVLNGFVRSFDVFLKIIKFLIKQHKVNCEYPANCIKQAVKFGLLAKEKIYLEMLEDKYKIIQLKDKRCPEELFNRVQVMYIPLLANFLKKVGDNYLV